MPSRTGNNPLEHPVHFDWPGMINKIKNHVKACEVFQKFKLTAPKNMENFH